MSLQLVNAPLPSPAGTVKRGTSNGNDRGSTEARRRRRGWLIETYRADVDVVRVTNVHDGGVWYVYPTDPVVLAVWLEPGDFDTFAEPVPACRCYRCGKLLTDETVTVDRIVPGCKGGTYRRNNIRPACGPCNAETGGALRGNAGKARSPKTSTRTRRTT